MPRLQLSLVPLCLALLAPSTGLAQSSDDMNQQQTTSSAVEAVPGRGMTMDQVKQQFGEPRRYIPPVGDPPISRWQYDGMVVYFEHQYVIHTVATSDYEK
jgi:hypothetical protein